MNVTGVWFDVRAVFKRPARGRPRGRQRREPHRRLRHNATDREGQVCYRLQVRIIVRAPLFLLSKGDDGNMALSVDRTFFFFSKKEATSDSIAFRKLTSKQSVQNTKKGGIECDPPHKA